MSAVEDRLAEIEAQYDAATEGPWDEVIAALRAVLALHVESKSGGWCSQQEGGHNEVWPCPTMRAITAALCVTA
ncbi:MAG: hypothetical protein JJE50_01545 [Actinomycetales bacterium]|nr:hypothetical protein [Actinomycetales bacterium]